MGFSSGLRRVAVAILAVALTLPACAPPQKLQTQYPNFGSCFRDQKKIATAGGALLGGVMGVVLGGNNRGRQTALGAAGAVVGGIIGNRAAWQACLTAFPVRVQTTVIETRPSSSSGTATPAATGPSLAIVAVQPDTLMFGPDLNVTVTYRYLSGRADARDVKAKVHRNLIFTGPDGARQEIETSSDDTIQQGTSRSNFSMPTPSLQDSPELASTTHWAVRLIVEVEGMRQEQTVALNVPQLSAGGTSGGAVAVPASAPSGPGASPNPQLPTRTAAAPEAVRLRGGIVLYREPNSTVVSARVPEPTAANVVQRAVVGDYNWVQVQLPDGREGWFRGTRR